MTTTTMTRTMARIRTRSARRKSVRSVRKRRRRSIRSTVVVIVAQAPTMLTGVVQVLAASTRGANPDPVPGTATRSTAGRRARAAAPSAATVKSADTSSQRPRATDPVSKSPRATVASKSPQDMVASKSLRAMVASKSLRAMVASKNLRAMVARKNPTAEADTSAQLRLPSTVLVTCLVALKKSPSRDTVKAAVMMRMSTAPGGPKDMERRAMDAGIRLRLCLAWSGCSLVSVP
jgi:hypothetical protein